MFRKKKSRKKKKRKRKKSSRTSSGKDRGTGNNKPVRQDSATQKENPNGSEEREKPAEEKESRETRQQDAHTYVWNDCVISYQEADKQYQIVNNSFEDIAVYNEDMVIGEVKSGETMSVDHFQVLERKETKKRLRMQ